MNAQPETAIQDLPIACSLTEAELARREEELSNELFQHVEQVQELPDGYAFRFPGDADWATKLTQFITFERDCCPFFIFELTFEANHGPIWLHLRGGAGVKEFIQQNWGL